MYCENVLSDLLSDDAGSSAGVCRSGTESGNYWSTQLTWSASHQRAVISCRMTSLSSFMSLFLPTFSSDQSSLSVSRTSAVSLVIPLSQTTLLVFTCHWCGRPWYVYHHQLCWHFLWITFFHFPAVVAIPASLHPACMLFLLSQLLWSHCVFTSCYQVKRMEHICCCSSTWSCLSCRQLERMAVMLYWQQRLWQMTQASTTDIGQLRLSEMWYFTRMISFRSAQRRIVNSSLWAVLECAYYATWAVFHTSHWLMMHCEAGLMGQLCHNVLMLAVTMRAGCPVVDCVGYVALVATHATMICHSLCLSVSFGNNSPHMVCATDIKYTTYRINSWHYMQWSLHVVIYLASMHPQPVRPSLKSLWPTYARLLCRHTKCT